MQDNLEPVSQAMMDELEEFGGVSFYVAMDLFNKGKFPNMEYYRSSRGIDNDYNVFYKFIKHINGEPQFEAEKPKKYIVRSKEVDIEGNSLYLIFRTVFGLKYSATAYVDDISDVEKFDTREEAEKWTNPLMEVVEVEE